MWDRILSIVFIILIVSPAIYGAASDGPSDRVSILRDAPGSFYLGETVPIRLIISATSDTNNSTVVDFIPEGFVVEDPGVAEIKNWEDFTELQWNLDLSGEVILEYYLRAEEAKNYTLGPAQISFPTNNTTSVYFEEETFIIEVEEVTIPSDPNSLNASITLEKEIYTTGETVNITIDLPENATVDLKIDIESQELFNETGNESFVYSFKPDLPGNFTASASITLYEENINLTVGFRVDSQPQETKNKQLSAATLSTDKDLVTICESINITISAQNNTSVTLTIRDQADELFNDEIEGFFYNYTPDRIGNYTVLANLFLLNETKNLTANFSVISGWCQEEPIHGKAEIGKSVKWTRKIFTSNNENISRSFNTSFELPEDATEVVVKDLKGIEENISVNEIKRRVMDLKEGYEYNVEAHINKTKEKEFNFNYTLRSEEHKVFTVEYETLAPYKEERIIQNRANYLKKVEVKSRASVHYQNVTTSTDIGEIEKSDIRLYWLNNSSREDVTDDPRYNVSISDTDGNEIMDMISWNVPRLSNQSFEVEADISIINVQSYPVVGGNWTVKFTTIGTGDHTITPINDTLFEQDLEFLELKCGDTILSPTYDGDRVFYSGYSCNETGYFTSKALTPGKHHLKFSFGSDTDYAHNYAVGDHWWNESWEYRMLINLTENSGSKLTDYQIPVTLNSSIFDFTKADSNGNDTRFTLYNATTDTETPIPHFIEVWNTTGQTVIWMNVTEIPASSTATVYIYYGNSGVSTGSDYESTRRKTYNIAEVYDSPTHAATTNIRDILEDAGYNVTLVDDGDVASGATDLSGYDMIVFGRPDMNANGLGEKLRSYLDDENIPIITGLEGGTIEQTYTSGLEVFGLNFTSEVQEENNNDGIIITDNTHYITSPFSTGDLIVYTSADYQASASKTGSIGNSLADREGETSYSSIQVIDAGTLDLNSVNTRQRITHLGFLYRNTNNDGDNLIERAVNWTGFRKYVSSEPTVNLGAEESSTTWMDYFGGSSGIDLSSNVTVSGGEVNLNDTTSAGTETLRPNAVGDETNIGDEDPNGIAHWDAVNDTTPDGDSTRIEKSCNGYATDLYNIQNHTVGSGTINKITVYALFTGPSGSYVVNTKTAIKTGGTVYERSVYTTTNRESGWVTASGEWTNNNSTGNPWTWDEIDDLQIGVSLDAGQILFCWSCYCTQVYVDVDYTLDPVYNSTGNITSLPMVPSSLGCWGKFYANDTINETLGTNITYNILDASDDSVLCTITSAQAAAGYDISSCASSATSIKLNARFTTSDTSYTPMLYDWNVTWYTSSQILVEVRNSSATGNLSGWSFPTGELGTAVTVPTQNSSAGTPTCTIYNAGNIDIDVWIYSSNFTDGSNEIDVSVNEKMVIRSDGNSTTINWGSVSEYVPYSSPGTPQITSLSQSIWKDLYFQLNLPLSAESGAYNATFYVDSAAS